MDLLSSLSVFLRVAETSSFSKAADGLGLSRPKVSRIVQELETNLGARLFYRTTRKVTLTAEGEELQRRSRDLLSQSKKLVEDIKDSAGKPLSGSIRIASSGIIACVFLQGVVARFLKAHPLVSVELVTADRTMQLPEEGIDLAFQVGSGMKESLIARKLGSVRSILCAAPGYFKGRTPPASPEELKHEVFLKNLFFGTRCRLVNEAGMQRLAEVNGRYASRNSLLIFNACFMGEGIAMMPVLFAQPYIEQGSLMRVLPGWEGEALDFFAIYYDRSLSRAARAVLAAVTEELEKVQGQVYDPRVRAVMRFPLSAGPGTSPASDERKTPPGSDEAAPEKFPGPGKRGPR